MSADDRASQRLTQRFEEVLGEPEATMLMDRLVTRHEIAEVVRSGFEGFRVDLFRELDLREERLRAEIQRTARGNLAVMISAMGIFNATLFAALKFF